MDPLLQQRLWLSENSWMQEIHESLNQPTTSKDFFLQQLLNQPKTSKNSEEEDKQFSKQTKAFEVSAISLRQKSTAIGSLKTL